MNNFVVQQIANSNEWEDFNEKQLNTLFVQSIHYGKFYRQLGEQSWIFGLYQNNKLVGGSLVVSVHARRGNFIFLPYGPIFEQNVLIKEGIQTLTKFLRQFVKEQGYGFIRVSPFLADTMDNLQIFKSLGYRSAPMHILAETTWMLNLNQTEEELLEQMNKNHRNLIRRCIKEGVVIKMSSELSSLADFNKLHDNTASRHKFHRFSNGYIEKEFTSFALVNQALIFNAYLSNGELDASAIVMYYQKMAAYRHGASLNLDHKIPTSYLIQWEAIKEAKKRGMTWYNFWGIAPDNAPTNHPFKGITHFKKGFGGQQFDLMHCQDLPISWKYWLNWLVESIRRLKRGF